MGENEDEGIPEKASTGMGVEVESCKEKKKNARKNGYQPVWQKKKKKIGRRDGLPAGNASCGKKEKGRKKSKNGEGMGEKNWGPAHLGNWKQKN